MSILRAHALAYARKGIAVFPLEARGKRPLTPRGFLNATSDVDRVHTWWERMPSANIGLRTGQLVVVDIDGPRGHKNFMKLLDKHNGRKGTYTAAVWTPRGGTHLYFRAPPAITIPNRRDLVPSVDVRGEGGYVVAPPSIGPSGHPYKVASYSKAQKRKAIELPDWLVQLILPPPLEQRPREPLKASNGLATAYGAAATRKWQAQLSEVPEGSGRTNELYRAACSLGRLVGRGELEEEYAVEQLAEIAEDIGLNPYRVERQIRKGLAWGSERA